MQTAALSLRGAGCPHRSPGSPHCAQKPREGDRGPPGAPPERAGEGLSSQEQGQAPLWVRCPYLPAVSCSHFSNNAFRACAPDVRGSVCDLTSSRRRAWAVAGGGGDGGDRGGVARVGLRREPRVKNTRPPRAQGPPAPRSDRVTEAGEAAGTEEAPQVPGPPCRAGLQSSLCPSRTPERAAPSAGARSWGGQGGGTPDQPHGAQPAHH